MEADSLLRGRPFSYSKASFHLLHNPSTKGNTISICKKTAVKCHHELVY
jgi:hypothetical protein